jgi:glycine cleavage system H protein
MAALKKALLLQKPEWCGRLTENLAMEIDVSDQYRNFMGYLWILKEGDVYTIGINEEGLEEISEIESVELPQEREEIESDVVIGSLETSDGPLDIYSPVSGTVIEINSAVVDEPDLIQEDPYDAWLLKIESDEDLDDVDDEEDEEDDDDDDEEEDEESEEEE